MPINFLDTETTGFVSNNLSANHPQQAHICQLGSILIDDNERVIGELNILIKPDGWVIPPAATEIHGITTEMCQNFGVPLSEAMSIYRHYHLNKSQLLVAHNLTFDWRMIALSFAQLNLGELPQIEGFCTMLATTDMCQLPKTRGSGYKWPKLIEAYYFFFNEMLDCAHDAMADVHGCKRVYYELQRRKQFKQGPDSSVTIKDSPL